VLQDQGGGNGQEWDNWNDEASPGFLCRQSPTLTVEPRAVGTSSRRLSDVSATWASSIAGGVEMSNCVNDFKYLYG
jgi:hypothetical protein